MEIQLLDESGNVIAVLPCATNITRSKALDYAGCFQQFLNNEMPCTRAYIRTAIKYVMCLVGDLRQLKLIGPGNVIVGEVVISED